MAFSDPHNFVNGCRRHEKRRATELWSGSVRAGNFAISTYAKLSLQNAIVKVFHIDESRSTKLYASKTTTFSLNYLIIR